MKVSYKMSLRNVEEKDREKANLDKIGGEPTHLPPMDLYDESYYFLMQIYNKEYWNKKEGILCWQFYQERMGGPISAVIKVPVGAALNDSHIIKKRRWLCEYVIEYEKFEEYEEETLFQEIDVDDIDDFYSQLNSLPDETLYEYCKEKNYQYAGIIYESMSPISDLRFGYGWMEFAFDEKNNVIIIR